VLFSHLQVGEQQVLRKRRRIWGHWVYVSALRLEDGKLLVVITNHRPHQAISDYGKRWAIEMLQPQCPHKSEAIEAEAVSALTVFGASEHSLQHFKGIRESQFQWVTS
jgi:hypothetical protein